MAENLRSAPSDAEGPPDECANCGAKIPRHARACPECGADEHTGWREQSVYDDLDLPDSAYADDEPAAPRPSVPSWLWPAVAVMLLVALVLAFVFRR